MNRLETAVRRCLTKRRAAAWWALKMQRKLQVIKITTTYETLHQNNILKVADSKTTNYAW
jgi:hypothetical protein